jgi:hypothetical protein
VAVEHGARSHLGAVHHHPEAAGVERRGVAGALAGAAVLHGEGEVVILGQRVGGHGEAVAAGREAAPDHGVEPRGAEHAAAAEAPRLAAAEHSREGVLGGASAPDQLGGGRRPLRPARGHGARLQRQVVDDEAPPSACALDAQPVEVVPQAGDEAGIERGVAVEDQDAFGGHQAALDEEVDAGGLRGRSWVLDHADRRPPSGPPPRRQAGRHARCAAAPYPFEAQVPKRGGHDLGCAVAAAVDAHGDLVDAHALRQQRGQRQPSAGLLVEHGQDGRQAVPAPHRVATVPHDAERGVHQDRGHGQEAGELGHVVRSGSR